MTTAIFIVACLVPAFALSLLLTGVMRRVAPRAASRNPTSSV